MQKKYLLILFFIAWLISCQKTDAPATIDLCESWRFAPDDQNRGLSEKWYAPAFDDSRWAIIAAGNRWEDQGYPDIDSTAWYRKVVQIRLAGETGVANQRRHQ
jgi:beta-galactosidase/beta-glucuronidase